MCVPYTIQSGICPYRNTVCNLMQIYITFKWKLLATRIYVVCIAYIYSASRQPAPMRKTTCNENQVDIHMTKNKCYRSVRWWCWFFTRFSFQFPYESVARAYQNRWLHWLNYIHFIWSHWGFFFLCAYPASICSSPSVHFLCWHDVPDHLNYVESKQAPKEILSLSFAAVAHAHIVRQS